MGINTKIEWCHDTANLWWGCVRVHAGCDHCYAETLSRRWKRDIWGNDKPRMMIKSTWTNLDNQEKLAKQTGERRRVFVGSMMDIFEKPMPLVDHNGEMVTDGVHVYPADTGQLRDELFERISLHKYDNLIFLLLTKRPSNINKYVPSEWLVMPPENVMFGTSVSDQETADTLIPQLLKVRGYKFLSIEPQLAELSIMPWAKTQIIGNSVFVEYPIHWIINGGESGPRKRYFNCGWGRKLRDECKMLGVPFFFKQVDKVEKIPEDLMIREFPEYHKAAIVNSCV